MFLHQHSYFSPKRVSCERLMKNQTFAQHVLYNSITSGTELITTHEELVFRISGLPNAMRTNTANREIIPGKAHRRNP